MIRKSREIHLRRYPSGTPEPEDFELVETELRAPRDGEVLVQNLFMSVDPYMRGRMSGRTTYVPPYHLGQPLQGGCVGRALLSRHPDWNEGDYVLAGRGWREHFLSDGTDLERIDPSHGPLQAYLGVLGMPGMTAYVGLRRIAPPEPGESVFVSAASGAVGSVACQIAKIDRCTVVGTAGSNDKIAWLREEAGIDAAFNYKEVPNVRKALAKAAPGGVDVYFDNVGGPQLEAAISCMNPFGRIVLCGMISKYNDRRPTPGPPNLMLAVVNRLRLQGFIVRDHEDLKEAFRQDMAAWIAAGKVHWKETVFDGLENAPRAFLGLFEGRNFGKMLVRIADESEP